MLRVAARDVLCKNPQMSFMRSIPHTNWSWLLLLAVVIGGPMNVGCKEPGRERSAAATKAILELKAAHRNLTDYATTEGGRFPDSLTDANIKIGFPHKYVGRAVSVGQSPPHLLIYAVPEDWSDTGVSVLWSDGTAETIAYKGFATTTQPTQRGEQR